MTTLLISKNGSDLVLEGNLTLQTITRQFEKKSIAMLSKEGNIINLVKVTKADTAGLAWMLLLIENAKKKETSIKFSNIPNELEKLAKLSAVDSFLTVQ